MFLTCSVEGLSTFSCTVTFSCDAFSPACEARLPALELKELQPADKELHALERNSDSSLGGGWTVFPNPVYLPPWLGGRSLYGNGR